MDERDYRERLARDVGRWRRDGIIEQPQERAILASIGAGTPAGVRALRLGWFVSAIAIIGALVLAAGVVLLFATNWEEMPDTLRVGALAAAIIGAYASGYALIYRFDSQRIGSALLLLGYLLYVAAVFLIAQIYNMPQDSPVLWLLAAFGGLPLAYAFASRIILLLSVGMGLAWVISELIQRYSDTPQEEASFVIVGAFGVALYAIGRMHAVKRSLERFGDAYLFVGALVTLGLIYGFTFDDAWDELSVEAYAAPALVYVSLGIAGALVAAQWALRGRTMTDNAEAGVLAGLLGVAGAAATWPQWDGQSLLFNAAYFATAAALVARGYLGGDERYVNFGLAVVGIGLLTRYCDLFWDQLSTSLFFMAGGVFLLVLAFGIERLRGGLITGMNDDDDAPPANTPVEALI